MNSTIPDGHTAAKDSALLARFVRERDEAAFGQLVGRYETTVMGAALRRTGNVETARDVAQQVFVTLAKKAGTLLGHGCLGGWMYRAASFEASRLMKSELRRRKRETAWTGEDDSVEAADPEKWEDLENALAKMPAGKRDLVVMHYFQDRGYADMALELGLTEATTRKRMSRALEELGRMLRKSGATTPAVQLLAGAVAAQSVLTPSPAAAATSLQTVASAGGASFSSGTILSTMTSTTFFKATTAAVVLAAVPLGLQWSETRAAERELESARQSQSPAEGPVNPAMLASRNELLAKIETARIRDEFTAAELEAARNDLDERKLVLEQMGTEVVVTHGNPEELAVRLMPLMKLLVLGVQVEDGEDLPPDVEIDAMTAMMNAMPDLRSVIQLDEDPQAKARFVSRLIIETAKLDEALQEEMETNLVAEMVKAKEAGLVFGERPPEESPGYAAWGKKYDSAVRKQAMSVAQLLPSRVLESELWKLFTDGSHGGVADMYAGIAEMSGGVQGSLRASEPDMPVEKPKMQGEESE